MDTEVRLTHRWRELDSNHRSRLFEVAFQRRRRERFVADSSLEEDGFELPVRGRGKPGYRPFCAAQAPSRSHSVATNASSSTGSRDRRSARISPLAQCAISNRYRISRPSCIPISTLLRRFRTGILCGDELAGAGRRIQTLAFSGASAFGGTRECQICLPCAWPHRPSAAPARPNTSW